MLGPAGGRRASRLAPLAPRHDGVRV